MEEHPELLRLVRAVSMLDGVAAAPTRDGVLLPGATGSPAPLVGWSEIGATLAGADPIDPAPRRRLALLLELRQHLAALGPLAGPALARAARPLALPAGHLLHPGDAWVREHVPGGALDLGLGLARFLPGQDGVLPLPPVVAEAAGLDVDWARLRLLAHRLSTFALDRLEEHAAATRPAVRPGWSHDRLDGDCAALLGVGGCDALTLLAMAPVRAWLDAVRPGAYVSAPARDRVWLGAAAGDPDYVRAVWLLTPPLRRGVLEPLLAGRTGVRPAANRPQAPRSGASPTLP